MGKRSTGWISQCTIRHDAAAAPKVQFVLLIGAKVDFFAFGDILNQA